MEKPLVAILVPTFNPNPVFLREALDSILHQTEQRWICFIHDDASNVDVRSIVEPYLRDSRFSFQKSNKRLGIGGNWNACLKHRSSDSTIAAPRFSNRGCGPPFSQYLFQDDRWYFTYLREMLMILDNHPHVGFVSADHLYECEKDIPTESAYEDLRSFKNDHLAPGIHRGESFLRWWLDHELHPNIIGEPSFVMMRRELVERIGTFREDMPQFLDVEYWTRLLLKTNWYYHPSELGVFRVHRSAASFINDASGAGIYDRFRCFESLKMFAPPHIQPAIAAARNTALKGMVAKFLDRLYCKKKITAKGSSPLRKFVLRHPLLVGKTVTKILLERLGFSLPLKGKSKTCPP